MRKKLWISIGLCFLLVIFGATSLLNVQTVEARPRAQAFQYHFQVSPFANIIHLNVNPGGWLNGYQDLGPAGWNPVLGIAESGGFLMAIDVLPDQSPGYYETLFLIGSVATRTGQMIRTYDGLTFEGPTAITLVPVAAEAEHLDGPDITEVSGGHVTPDAWYTFQLSPYIDIIHLNTNPGNWLNGYDDVYDPDAPVLGYAYGNRFWFCIDAIDPLSYYELVFIAGTISTRNGDMIRTVDGNTYDGPYAVTLLPVSYGGAAVATLGATR